MRKIVKCGRCGHEQYVERDYDEDCDLIFDFGDPDLSGYGKSNPNYGKPLFWREDRVDDFPKGGCAEYGGI